MNYLNLTIILFITIGVIFVSFLIYYKKRNRDYKMNDLEFMSKEELQERRIIERGIKRQILQITEKQYILMRPISFHLDEAQKKLKKKYILKDMYYQLGKAIVDDFVMLKDKGGIDEALRISITVKHYDD